jgi:cyclopropane fatty-acyl-phospholipid synthase-like methyltransferase
MNQLLYRLIYWLGMTHWEAGETPQEVREAFLYGGIPPGAALDLGCGTGTNAIYMAMQGRQVIGLDFVPEAIRKARRKAQQAGAGESARFEVADVTRLDEMELPQCGFALDMGCFHGLSTDGQRGYVAGLVKALVPGGRYMLYTLNPRKEAGFTFGMKAEDVQAVFSPWFTIERVARRGSRSRGSTWFWMVRKDHEQTSWHHG